MTANITFFPVDNGDMTLIQLADTDKTSIMIDVNIRKDADDLGKNTFDVAKDLRSRLKADKKGRPYVDVFLLSHPDKDHCTGLDKHFYLGDLEKYPDDNKKQNEKRIVIREIWSSPIVFRRASKNHTLCEDAKAFNKEAKRRVKVNRESNFNVEDGNRILVLGEDEKGKNNKSKTDDLGKILIKVDERFSKIKGKSTSYLEALLIAPRPVNDDDDDREDLLSKNNSSIILNLRISASLTKPDGCHFLTGGDAEVAIWEKVWNKYKGNSTDLEYDLLQAPHHCSWHSLSHDSWSDSDNPKVSPDAHSALSQAKDEASIVSSSKAFVDGETPPCIGAKKEYEKIVDNVGGIFYCTGEHPKKVSVKPLEFEVGKNGGIRKSSVAAGIAIITSSKAPRAG